MSWIFIVMATTVSGIEVEFQFEFGPSAEGNTRCNYERELVIESFEDGEIGPVSKWSVTECYMARLPDSPSEDI